MPPVRLSARARLRDRAGLAFLIVFFLSGGNCGSDPPQSAGSSNATPARPQTSLTPPKESIQYTPAACGVTGAASPGAMAGNALDLANLIVNCRVQSGQGSLVLDTTLAGVAQWHAHDMSTHGYTNIVGSDGEDPFTRLTCTNIAYSGTLTGVIALGSTTSPTAAFHAMQNDFSANGVLLSNRYTVDRIGVGYSDGYWMVLIQ